MKHAVTVLGDGAFGTAIATVLAHNGHAVTLWCHNHAVADTIEQHHCNTTYLPDIELSARIIPTTHLADALRNEIIFEAIPVKFMRSVLEQCKTHATAAHRWVVLSKGIEQETLLLPSQIIKNVLGKQTMCAVVAGPSYARDLALQQPTGVNIASDSSAFMTEIISLMANDYFKLISAPDMNALQLITAVKNVIALGIGILQGAGYSSNPQALFFMKMLDESKQLLAACGMDVNVIGDYAGIGDIVLTCFGAKSRNHAVGVMIGQGKKLDAILHETGLIPEGINTLASLQQLAQTKNLTLPLCTAMHEVVFEHKNTKNLLQKLIH